MKWGDLGLTHTYIAINVTFYNVIELPVSCDGQQNRWAAAKLAPD